MTESTAASPTADIPNILRDLTSHYGNILREISEDRFCVKEKASVWSGKEILGHLVDSAQNNLRRFITAQYELHPPHIVYDQDFWVKANGYQHAPVQDLIVLWKLLNDRIAFVLQNMPPERFEMLCNTGKGREDLHTLRFLAADYVAHTRHHLQQLVTYP